MVARTATASPHLAADRELARNGRAVGEPGAGARHRPGSEQEAIAYARRSPNPRIRRRDGDRILPAGGQLLANEMAPRVHNSGHWTIEGAVTSQFENHLRAIAGMPLGSTAARGHSAMLNLIGSMPTARCCWTNPGCTYTIMARARGPAASSGMSRLSRNRRPQAICAKRVRWRVQGARYAPSAPGSDPHVPGPVQAAPSCRSG